MRKRKNSYYCKTGKNVVSYIRGDYMITFDDIKKNQEIKTYIKRADSSLGALGYTEHSQAHVSLVAERAERILSALCYDERTVEIAKIAAYMHDIGNVVNRVDHSQSGALIAFRLLDKIGMDTEEIATIISAIGNHDEGDGVAVNPVAAALIIADKSDVRRTRVRNRDISTFDIHDRVNYSVIKSDIAVKDGNIILSLDIDTKISPVIDYFEIFLNRMLMCKRAALCLKSQFKLIINDQEII